MVAGLTLLLPDSSDAERDAVASAWEAAGGVVVRVGRFWERPPVASRTARVYGADTFCLVLAEKLELDLVTPDDRILASASESLLHRRLEIVSLATVRASDFPRFLKPVVPKQFRSGVYASLHSLENETRGLDGATEVIVSEVVVFVAEARAFVCEAIVRACAVYEGTADVGQATKFA